MCIVIIKPQGQPLPTSNILSNCWESNPDGAGFMYARNGSVHIHKGFTSVKALNKGLKQSQVSKADTLILHFRIATAGKVTPHMTHPFPLSSSESDLLALKISTPLAMAHNGVIGKGEGPLSDTAVYVRDILSNPIIHLNLGNPAILSLIQETMKFPKLAILDGGGNFYTMGSFIIDKGLWYSNDTYKTDSLFSWAKSWKSSKGKSWYREPDSYVDVIQCPVCGEIDEVKTLSARNQLYECQTCQSVFDDAGNEFLMEH